MIDVTEPSLSLVSSDVDMIDCCFCAVIICQYLRIKFSVSMTNIAIATPVVNINKAGLNSLSATGVGKELWLSGHCGRR